jgi:hypothetical protein
MKRSIIVIAAGCLVALALGLALAFPLLDTEMPVMKSLELGVDAVYVYIGKPNLDANVTGLWRNSTNHWEGELHFVSYVIVLNITNLSNEFAYVTNFELIVGPKIILPSGNSGVGATNPILHDTRVRVDIENTGFESLMRANESRLVRLSGFTGVHNVVYEKLKSDPMYVYATADGRATEARIWHSGYVYKPLDFKESEGNYLYNRLLGENQLLAFSRTLDVYIIPTQ